MSAPADLDLAKYVNLASPRLGTVVHAASDEFFGAKERLIQDAAPVFIADKYDDNGKWMDGWETRRRRDVGHDWCLVRLGVPGTIAVVDIDTRFFTGNYPPGAALEGRAGAHEPTADSDWRSLLPPSALGPGAQHMFAVADARPVDWLRLSIFPDGGVARLRAYGRPVFDRKALPAGRDVELSALRYGGRILGFSDAHYGDPWVILTEGRGRDMGDGWETRRRREPGHDWMVIALGLPGVVSRIEVDTAHFKGNFPHRVSVQASHAAPGPDAAIIGQSMFWSDLLAPRAVRADAIHVFDGVTLAPFGPVTHVRLNMHPDGGISRFRVFGDPLQMNRRLVAEPLTKAAFAPWGDVVERAGAETRVINDGSTDRLHALASIDVGAGNGRPIVSIFAGRRRPHPLSVTILERHPLGSQCFFPLQPFDWLVVVGDPAPDKPPRLRCFRAGGDQGVNYAAGAWHHPLLLIEPRQDFLVIDREGPGANCEEIAFPEHPFTIDIEGTP